MLLSSLFLLLNRHLLHTPVLPVLAAQQARWLQQDIDQNTYDATDYAVLVTGLPLDAGFHEIGHFFSRFGDVVDVTLVLDMRHVLLACAKASKLENKRELLIDMMDTQPGEEEVSLSAKSRFSGVV